MIMTKKYISYLHIILVLFLIQACTTGSHKGPKVDKSQLVNIDVEIHRYGKALSETDTTNFLVDVSKIQNEFALFLGNTTYTNQQLAPLYSYVTDTQIIFLSNKVMEMYPSVEREEAQLSSAFTRYHYFFPNKKIPVVYTYISNLYHEKPVIVDDSVIIIALDLYLGTEFSQYRSLGLPNYKIICMQPDNIIVDVMKSIYVTDLAPHNKQKTLVDRMIASGKLLYYLDAMLPDVPDSLKICYTSEQIKWAGNNKSNVWAFMVENNLFYTADYKTQTKLMQDGPFTTGFTNSSPPRLGMWLGWQIVRKYMDSHPNVTVENLINNTDAQAIFNQSGYKP